MDRPMKFGHLKAGDKFTRLLAGSVPMELVVQEIKGDRIVTGGGWEFCRYTGAEIDDELQWGPQYGFTGSFIRDDSKNSNGGRDDT